MSQENVEIVSRLLVDDVDVVPLARDDATWAKRRSETEALFEPDASVAWIAHGQRPIEATGLDDARQSWLDWLEPWEPYRAQVERIVPVDDKVLVLARVHGRMAGTENDVELIFGSIYVAASRTGDPRRALCGPRRSARSRGAAGVGDVAGERGDCGALVRAGC